ncbi:MAG: hypothetical protein QXW96_03900 [Candidatus Nitrosocaldus sp.]
MIVIGDGTPDDIVVAILCHNFSCEDIVYVTKPEDKGIEALSAIRTYVEMFRQQILCYILIIDQEDLKMRELSEYIVRKLNRLGITKEAIKEEKRLFHYSCNVGNKKFQLILVINGLDSIQSESHTIEDHLLSIGIDNNVINTPTTTSINSKLLWNSLGRDKQERILSLCNNKETLRNAFPQHYRAFEILASIC